MMALGPMLVLEHGFERSLSALWIAFQPIVRAEGGRVFGHEAFVRSEHEPNMPAGLIEAAEQLDRLLDFGRATRRAIAAALEAQQPFDHHVFVNLHPHDLLDEQLFDRAAPLSKYATRVVLEITERSSLIEIPDLADRIAGLRAMGFRLAIDDLGSGYAGLASFTALEPDIAKLDMKLVQGIERSTSQRRFVSGLTKMCHELGMLVVAEGIETEPERDVLVELGCDLLQGYRFARPSRGFSVPAW